MDGFEEIDIANLVTTIASRWRFIVLIAIITALGALSISLILPREYQASATLILTRTRSTLELAEQFPTIVEPIDGNSRMNAMLAIVQSDDLSLRTLSKVVDQLPEDLQDLDEIKELVEIVGRGDAIEIQVSWKDPSIVALLANAWAQEATQAINLAYSGQQPLIEIQGQLVIRKNQYEISQANLEAFIENSQIDLLDRQIREAEDLLIRLSGDQSANIVYFSDRKIKLAQIILEAEALQRQLEAGTTSTAGGLGDALAVIISRATSLGIIQNSLLTDVNNPGYGSGITIDLQLTDLNALAESAPDYAADINRLIELARVERDIVEDNLSILTEDVVGGQLTSTIDEAATRLRELKTLREREESRSLQLISERDLAWDAYQALAQKEVEIKYSAQADERVTIASEAVPPSKPLSRGTIRNTFLAGVLGGLLGGIYVIFREWWKSIARSARPIMDNNP